MKRKREDLVSLFIEQDVELLRKTFEYEKSPVAFSLVRDQFITQWIDEHFEQIIDDDISDEVRKSAVKVCSQLISEDKNKDSGIAEFKQSITKDKLNYKYEGTNTITFLNKKYENTKFAINFIFKKKIYIEIIP